MDFGYSTTNKKTDFEDGGEYAPYADDGDRDEVLPHGDDEDRHEVFPHDPRVPFHHEWIQVIPFHESNHSRVHLNKLGAYSKRRRSVRRIDNVHQEGGENKWNGRQIMRE